LLVLHQLHNLLLQTHRTSPLRDEYSLHSCTIETQLKPSMEIVSAKVMDENCFLTLVCNAWVVISVVLVMELQNFFQETNKLQYRVKLRIVQF